MAGNNRRSLGWLIVLLTIAGVCAQLAVTFVPKPPPIRERPDVKRPLTDDAERLRRIVDDVRRSSPPAAAPAAAAGSAPKHAEPPARRTGVTRENYLALHTGMSYADAVAILGSPGEEISRSDIAGYTTVMYQWTTAFGLGNMNAMFQNDKLIQKAQFGLR